jgi:hypothetical protein
MPADHVRHTGRRRRSPMCEKSSRVTAPGNARQGEIPWDPQVAGVSGCAFEQHLAAVERALSNPANTGFLRPDAYLGVIIIADEDDCSLEHASLLADDPTADSTLGALQSFRCTRFGVLCDQGGQTPDAMNQVGTKNQCHPNDTSAYLTKVSDYATFLRGLKQDPSKVLVAAIAGTPEPFAVELRPPGTGATPIPALAHSCTYIGGDGKPEVADPPVRIKEFSTSSPTAARSRRSASRICLARWSRSALWSRPLWATRASRASSPTPTRRPRGCRTNATSL